MRFSFISSKWYAFTFFWAATILFFSIMPGEDLPSINLWESDKIFHAIVYAVLHFSLFRSLRFSGAHQLNIQKQIFVSFVLSFLYGLAIEIIQGVFLPSRSFDLFDIIANSIGCILTSLIIYMQFKKK